MLLDEYVYSKVPKWEESLTLIILTLQKTRRLKNISLHQLAEQAHVSHSTILRMENYSQAPTIDTICKIADALGLDINISVSEKDAHNLDQDVHNSLSNNQNVPVASEKFPVKSQFANSVFGKIIFELSSRLVRNFNYADNYIEKVEQMFAIYTGILEKNNISKHCVDKVKRFSKYHSVVISTYFHGQHEVAYAQFKDALSECINIENFCTGISPNHTFYRCRGRKPGIEYKKEDLFHISYAERYLVDTQRYSFPGLPCLYLGSSVEICAKELGRSVGDLAIATIKYMPTEKCKLLDLTSIFRDVHNVDTMALQEQFLECLPLVLACSIQIQYDNIPHNKIHFQQNHIFPQLLLEYAVSESLLKSEDLIGIKYYSTKIDFLRHVFDGDYVALDKSCNYVFPAFELDNGKSESTLDSCFYVDEIR